MRFDSIGRRIGRNLWRELITSSQRTAKQAWALRAETVTRGYDTEMRDYRARHPQPNLRDFMTGLSQGWTPCRQQSNDPVAAPGDSTTATAAAAPAAATRAALSRPTPRSTSTTAARV